MTGEYSTHGTDYSCLLELRDRGGPDIRFPLGIPSLTGGKETQMSPSKGRYRKEWRPLSPKPASDARHRSE